MTDFDPVEAAIETHASVPGCRSRYDTDLVRGWIEGYAKGYEQGKFTRWDWQHLCRVLKKGDPTLPGPQALKDFVTQSMPDVLERLQRAR